MLRAVPFTDSIADWIEKQFRSGILSVAKACYNQVFVAEFILASLGALRTRRTALAATSS
jgi:hypothetical protein